MGPSGIKHGADQTAIVGLDIATEARKTGLALAVRSHQGTAVKRVGVGDSWDSLTATVATHVRKCPRALLAIDAPLGWPAGLGAALVRHTAGDSLAGEPNHLFRRRTDRFIQERLGKTPLDVGADRIARTAHAALHLLTLLREALRDDIPLAPGPDFPGACAAIEVYPAGTLRAWGWPDRNYKKKADLPARRKILGVLSEHMRLPGEQDAIIGNADALDAVICILAAVDFLDGRAVAPDDGQLAAKEGWIWCRNPASGRRD